MKCNDKRKDKSINLIWKSKENITRKLNKRMNLSNISWQPKTKISSLKRSRSTNWTLIDKRSWRNLNLSKFKRPKIQRKKKNRKSSKSQEYNFRASFRNYKKFTKNNLKMSSRKIWLMSKILIKSSRIRSTKMSSKWTLKKNSSPVSTPSNWTKSKRDT